MSCRNNCVLRIHWTLKSSCDYGQKNALNEIHWRLFTRNKRGEGPMSAQITEIASLKRSSSRRPVRSRTVSTRVTEAEYSALQEQAWSSGKTVCDWARECITQQLGHGLQRSLDAHVFTELVGIQLLLMNTLGPIARGERMAAEEVDVVFREVQARKARKAQELLNKRLGREIERRGGPQTHSMGTAIS